MNTGQNNFPKTGSTETDYLFAYIFKRPGTNRPANIRNDTVRAMVVASFLNLEDGANMFVQSTD